MGYFHAFLLSFSTISRLSSGCFRHSSWRILCMFAVSCCVGPQVGLLPSGEAQHSGSRYTISEVTRQMAGVYECVAQNGLGKPGVGTVSLQVQCKWLDVKDMSHVFGPQAVHPLRFHPAPHNKFHAVDAPSTFLQNWCTFAWVCFLSKKNCTLHIYATRTIDDRSMESFSSLRGIFVLF